MNIRNFIKNTKVGKVIWPWLKKLKGSIILLNRKRQVMAVKKVSQKRKHIFYCGICESSNMGDIAQTYCTINWLRENYPNHKIVFCRTSVFMDENCDLVGAIKKVIRDDDIIFFQSGYNTHDLGGNEDYMHQQVIQAFPKHEIIMLPQTVYFKTKEREALCSRIYNSHKKMLFLARDEISESYATELFPNLKVVLYPDIVTSLIGMYDYSFSERNGIYLCYRNDIERFYTEEDYKSFEEILSKYDFVETSDTIITDSNRKIFKNLEYYVNGIVEKFSRYRLVVTDKFHGLIFSIIAGTPVVVLKTKDHKVTSGYQWFSKIYPEIVYYAESIYDLKKIVLQIIGNEKYVKPDSYFKHEYYDKLADVIKDWEISNGNM